MIIWLTSSGWSQDDITPDTPEVDAIIDGHTAGSDDFPMTGAVLLTATIELQQFDLDLDLMLCSSTLIAPDTVLLAAHCIDDSIAGHSLRNRGYYWTREPDVAILDGPDSGGWPSDAIRASNWVQHPGYVTGSTDVGVAQNHDLGLLFLDREVQSTDPAWVVTEEDAQTYLAQGAPVDMVGWGQQEAELSSGTFGVKMMGTSWIEQLGSHEFQVGHSDDGARQCHGDSGGPTFLRINGAGDDGLRVVGLTAHAYDTSGCDLEGAVNTRLDPYLSWIDDEMRAACTAGFRSWCDTPGLPTPTQVESQHLPAFGFMGCTTVSRSLALGWAWGLLLMWARRRP